MSGAEGKRIFGLDILRAIAVLLVLVGHSSQHFQPPGWFRWLWSGQGTLGVEIFFVLSGFLIGTIIIRLARSGRLHTSAMVWEFWQRRWARTLPLYFFFYLLYLRFDYLGVADLGRTYPFLFFMQNFAWPQLPFFQHSWSLAVEEWFYFLFPLVFLAFAADERAYRRPLLATCVVFIAGPVIGRMLVLGNVHDYEGFNDQVRMVVVNRLDAIFVGVLLALIRLEWPNFYARLRKFGFVGILGVIGIALYLALGVPGLIQHYWLMSLYFPIMSLVIAMSLPFVADVQSLGIRLLDSFVSYTSKISYSLYLGHICMLTLVNSLLDRLGVHVQGALMTMGVYLVYAAAFYGLATITYYYIEAPFLKLRNDSTK